MLRKDVDRSKNRASIKVSRPRESPHGTYSAFSAFHALFYSPARDSVCFPEQQVAMATFDPKKAQPA